MFYRFSLVTDRVLCFLYLSKGNVLNGIHGFKDDNFVTGDNFTIIEILPIESLTN